MSNEIDPVMADLNREYERQEAAEMAWEMGRDHREAEIDDGVEELITKDIWTLMEDGEFDSMLSEMLTRYLENTDGVDESALRLCEAMVGKAKEISRRNVEDNWTPEDM